MAAFCGPVIGEDLILPLTGEEDPAPRERVR